MNILLTDLVVEALKEAPLPVRRAFDKQLRFLAANLHHPSLHAKKYHESQDRWQARVDKNWRFPARNDPATAGFLFGAFQPLIKTFR